MKMPGELEERTKVGRVAPRATRFGYLTNGARGAPRPAAHRFKLILALAGALSGRASELPPVSNVALQAEISGDQLLLSWREGRPTFQLQGKANISDDWSNIGVPLEGNSTSVLLQGDQKFFRIVQDYTARYEVVFNATWSRATHPDDFPSAAHWSGLVGGVHSSAVHFWREGETASEGIRLMAERGRQADLLGEVNAAISAGTADFTLAGGGIGTSPGTVSLRFPQPMRRDYPLVTLCSMIAPSPDWFVAVDSLNLIESGEWIPEKTVTLFGYDAGTDSGVTFTSPDLVTTPRGVVTKFAGFPALVNGAIVPFGTFTFIRLE